MTRSPAPTPASDTPPDMSAGHTVYRAQIPAPMPTPDFALLRDRAAQLASRDIASGAVDVPGLLAGTTAPAAHLLFDEEARLAIVSAMEARLEARLEGIAHVNDAATGLLTPEQDGVGGSLAAAREEQSIALQDVQETKRLAAKAAEGLVDPIAADRRSVARILRLDVVRAIAVVAVALGIEGLVVASNMYQFLHLPDPWVAIAVAVTMLASLTVGPHLAGTQTSILLAHGLQRGRARAVSFLLLGLPVAFWLAVGLSLAFARVQVDAENAADRAGSSLAEGAAQLGLSGAAAGPSGAVVAGVPVLETVLWIAALLGLGVMVFCIEVTFHRPAHLHELRARRAHWSAQDRLIAIDTRIDQLLRQVQLQGSVLELTDLIHAQQPGLILDGAEVRKRDYDLELSVASGDPAMRGAIEDRNQRTATARDMLEREAVGSTAFPRVGGRLETPEWIEALLAHRSELPAPPTALHLVEAEETAGTGAVGTAGDGAASVGIAGEHDAGAEVQR